MDNLLTKNLAFSTLIFAILTSIYLLAIF